jgi:hypothetical protein
VLALAHLPRIRKLFLRDVKGKENLAALAAAGGLSGVRIMTVSSSDDETYLALARCPSLRGLADLFLDPGLPRLSPDAFAALITSDNVRNLVAMRLDIIYLAERGTQIVAQSPQLAGLKRLRIVGRIGDEGARALCESPYLKQVETLDLSCFKTISAASTEALRQRFGAALRFER